MNEVQIFGITNYFVITGIVLSGLWLGAYILSWIIQWAWSWVDESKVSPNNWVVSLFSIKLKDDWVRVDKYWKYHKYNKDGVKVEETDSSIDVGDSCSLAPPYMLILPIIWFGVLCLNFWYISMWFAMAITLAFILRMARRGQKLLTKHINDKEAHK